MKTDLSQETLMTYFRYSPHTGSFRRRLRRDRWGNEKVVDEEITSMNNRGYRWVRIFGETHLVHRLVVLYMTGDHPLGEVDHIDGDRLNNKWTNLRDVNPFENARNQGVRKDCTSGVRGVTFNKNSGKWVARISHRGVRHSLGYHVDKRDAVKARRDAEKRFGFHPNHARRKSWRNG